MKAVSRFYTDDIKKYFSTHLKLCFGKCLRLWLCADFAFVHTVCVFELKLLYKVVKPLLSLQLISLKVFIPLM